MIKSIVCGIAGVLIAGTALAQGVELFPELAGQFRPAEPTRSDEQAPAGEPDAVQSGQVSVEEVVGAKGEGNLEVSLTNLEGTLPFARNFSYCFADVVLNNKMNRRLENLTMTLVYGNEKNQITFSGVGRNKTQTQKLMMVGPGCEDILSQPQVDVQDCRLAGQTTSCKDRVQFTPPNQ